MFIICKWIQFIWGGVPPPFRVWGCFAIGAVPNCDGEFYTWMCIYTEISFSTHMWFTPYRNGTSNYLTFASRDRDMVATYTIPAWVLGYHILRAVCRTMYTVRSTTYVELRTLYVMYVMYKGHTYAKRESSPSWGWTQYQLVWLTSPHHLHTYTCAPP